MTDSNLLELAKLGDPQAIETLMNQSLQSRGMRATVDRQGDWLEVILEAERIPNRQALTAFVQKGISNLGIQSIQSIRILGQQVGASNPAWMQELQLGASPNLALDSAPLNIQPEIHPETTVETTTIQEGDQLPEVEIDALSPASEPLSLPNPPENQLDPLWSEQSSEITPDFLQELLAEEPVASTDIADESDEELLDFLNDLSGSPASEDFPAEPAQDQSIFIEDLSQVPTDAEFQELFAESSPQVPASEPWMDSIETPNGEPDVDLLDFLNEPELEPVETFDLSSDLSSGVSGESAAGPLIDPEQPELTELRTISSLDQLPELFSDSSDAETSLDQPSEEFLSALLGESAVPAVDAPLDSGNDLSSSSLESQIEDLFASETDDAAEPFTEEILPEALPDGDEDLQQALVSEPSPETSLSSEAVREPWMEGTEDFVLGVPDDVDTQPTATPIDLFADRLDSESFELAPPSSDSSDAQTVLELPDETVEETTQPWQVTTASGSAEGSVLEPTPEEPLTASDLTPADFSLDQSDNQRLSPEQPGVVFWSDQFSDADVEEIPPDFLLDFQDEPEFSDFLPAPEPQLEPPEATETEPTLIDSFDFPDDFLVEPTSTTREPAAIEPLADSEPQSTENAWTEDLPDISQLPSLEAELAALELTPLPRDSFTDASVDSNFYSPESEPLPNDFANVTPDQPDAELADLLSETPEGTAIEPSETGLEEPTVTEVMPVPTSGATLEEPSVQPISRTEEQPNISQDALEAGLGDFREGFVEPLPQEFFDDEANPARPDWQADLRDPLELDSDESQADYIIEDNTPEYTPPPLPPQPEPAPTMPSETQGPPWLFTTVLVGLCILIGGLLGFSLFWSRVSPPSSPPPTGEPPAEPPAPAPSPASPTSANPVAPVSEGAKQDTLTLAIDRASDAVTLSQAAQSVDDWGLVASKWQQAIALLQSVPSSSADYAAAQQKLANYQANLATAQQKANQPIVAAVPLGQANIKALTPAAAAISCSPVASTPDAQPVELSSVQFDPAVDQAEASPIVGCITNHTEQPIAAINVAYKGGTPEADAAPEATGKLNFAQLNPKQTVPFKSEFTLLPAIKDVTIASISWTPAGETEAKQLPTSISVVRTEPEEGAQEEG